MSKESGRVDQKMIPTPRTELISMTRIGREKDTLSETPIRRIGTMCTIRMDK